MRGNPFDSMVRAPVVIRGGSGKDNSGSTPAQAFIASPPPIGDGSVLRVG
jgi:hypothetical protein